MWNRYKSKRPNWDAWEIPAEILRLCRWTPVPHAWRPHNQSRRITHRSAEESQNFYQTKSLNKGERRGTSSAEQELLRTVNKAEMKGTRMRWNARQRILRHSDEIHQLTHQSCPYFAQLVQKGFEVHAPVCSEVYDKNGTLMRRWYQTRILKAHNSTTTKIEVDQLTNDYNTTFEKIQK